MGYKSRGLSVPFATHVELEQCGPLDTPLSTCFINSIRRRLAGFVVS